ncbi:MULTISPECIES: RcpC/CpaB family pilus assembly protein [unclassified Streptomyces]|uniref:RcpC/CpaB family pilus assembly protein n=1 Tax=unclassified Streptomyces TaxID=2593676 RepID=UPI0033186B00
MKIQERTGAGNSRSAAPVQPAVGERLPAPPRERKPALAALAVLLILIGALGATVLVLRAGDRIEVVQVTAEIPAGESVVRDKNVSSVMVAEDSAINYVKWSQLDSLTKLKATNTIPKGAVAVGEMFSSKSGLPAGKSAVGVSLKEGQYPADGVKAGDSVDVYQVGDSASSGSSDKETGGSAGSSASDAPIVSAARVSSVAAKSDATVSTGSLGVTLLVDSADAAAVTRAASAGAVSLVQVSPDGN